MLTHAQQGFDQQTGRPGGRVPLQRRRARTGSARRPRENVGKRFAIVLDNKVISAPVIQSRDHRRLGRDHRQLHHRERQPAGAAAELRRPAGAAEGDRAEAPSAPTWAPTRCGPGRSRLAIGAALIFAFIILAYGLFGVFAAIALVVNLLMMFGALSMTQATLTLPGIAGLILTMAVAVDANVLIYERMRDEAQRRARGDGGRRRRLPARPDLDLRRQRHHPDLGPDHVLRSARGR